MTWWFLSEDLKNLGMKEFRGHTDTSGKRMWTSGHRFDDPFPAEEFQVSTRVIGYGFPDGDDMPDLFDTTVPLMSERLLKALMAAGVDNIDAYPVKMVDQAKGLIWNNYHAINVIGRVDALDRANTKTKRDINTSSNPCYLSVAIDDARAHDLLCFRLHKGPREMVIHEKVASQLAPQGFKGVLLVRTEDFDQSK
jgi:hypothetical protein